MVGKLTKSMLSASLPAESGFFMSKKLIQRYEELVKPSDSTLHKILSHAPNFIVIPMKQNKKEKQLAANLEKLIEQMWKEDHARLMKSFNRYIKP